jgi:hypothetical protein
MKTKFPPWAVMTKSTPAELEKALAILEREFAWRTDGEWTAMFCLEDDPPGDASGAKLLIEQGFAPVYLFDMSKNEWFCNFWDGEKWRPVPEPEGVFVAHRMRVPGWDDPREPPDPSWAVISREVSILENATPKNVRALCPDDNLRVEAGPRGTIVYDADVNTQIMFWRRAPARVFEARFTPKTGFFQLTIMHGDSCLGTFRPNETRTWDGTPFLADVEGETDPARIIALFGIDPAFLAPA